jgi:hypothetical protein
MVVTALPFFAKKKEHLISQTKRKIDVPVHP